MKHVLMKSEIFFRSREDAIRRGFAPCKKLWPVFLNHDNTYDKCLRDERRTLKTLKHQLSPEQKRLFDNISVTAEPDHKKYINGLDMNEIQHIQSAYF